MKKQITFLMLTILALVLFSCKEENLEEDIKYNLIIDNQNASDVDIYINANLDNTGFVNEGTVLAGSEKTLAGYVLGVQYTIRAVESGLPVENYFDEQDFSNSDPEKFDVKITITN